jgi:hypothetical protein
MSLHKFAEQVAANGRGDDSLLVHMTPDEVRKLQQFAEANGTTLTINPETGLPEAGFLSDLFKAVAPLALGAFLGPGAFGIAGMGMSAGMAGLTAGGLTTLATGSLSRGLMAGLGAYGGAGLAGSLMDAGSASLASTAGATAGAEATQQGLSEALKARAIDDAAISQGFNEAVGKTAASDVFSAGTKSAMANPMAFAKNNLTNIGMAAAPIMAGAMVPTTTKMPDPKDHYIRMMDYNINPDTGKPDPLYGMREMTPIKTSDFKGKTFQSQRELFRQQNPNPYELGVGSLNQPPQQQQATPMATGGIVALAAGGPPTMSSAEDLFKQTGSWEAAAAARDAQNNALNQYNWAQQAAAAQAQTALPDVRSTPAAVVPDASDWWAKQPGGVDALYSTINQQLAANPNMTDAQVDAAMKQYGISNEDVAAALGKGGGSKAEEYSLLAGNMGLSGLNTNINDWIAKARQDPTFRAKTGLQQQEAAMAAMGTVNMNEADVLRATGKTIAELFPSTLTKPVSVIPGGTQLPGATEYANGAFGNYGSGPATGVDYRGNTVSIATPGDIITNPDGTRTVVPNIPGRPYGGFTGVEQLKSRYTAGGGSLGYTAPIPKDPEAAFNTLTDDSLDAYKFLMGKGKNLAQRKATADRPVAQRYDEAVLGRKATKLTKPGTTTTKTDTTKVLNSDGTVNQEETDKANFDYAGYLKANPDVQAELDKGIATFGTKDDLASAAYNHYVIYGKAQKRPLRAAEGGMMGYAMGGGLGSLGSYSDGGRLLKGPGDGVSDSIPATIGNKQQPARLADGEFVVPARIVSELGNGSTDAGAKKLYAMMDRVQRARGKTTGKNKVAANSRADKYLPA